MKINVVQFARLKELVGSDRTSFSMDEGCTVADMKSKMLEQHPEIGEILRHCSISVNHEYSDDDSKLTDGCEVGLIPPVSGG